LRILHIITRLIVGGAQENTLLTCAGLHARGHEVILLTGPSPGPEGTLLERARQDGYRVIVTPHLVRAPHPWHDYLAYRQIRRLCRELRPDVVHTHSSKAGIVGRFAAWPGQGQGIPRRPLVVHTVHGLAFHRYERKAVNAAWIFLERAAARRCHAIISVADAMTRQALAAGIGTPEQYQTIYSGMDIHPFVTPPPGVTAQAVRQRLGIPADRLVFATIARLQPLKGHDDLLAAAGTILTRVPNAHWLWIGDGVFRGRLEQQIAARGWREHFTLTGLVRPEQVAEILPAADIVVHPSYREGLARALPQGLLAGKPVISYDCDGAGEVCLTGRTGSLVPTGDVGALAAAMIALAEAGSGKRAEMGRAGRALCKERFDAQRMVEQIETLYKHVLGVS
jgi:glycosyltransferase involved in cell wall biosynthesis